MGPGVGPEGILPQPDEMSDRFAAQQLQYWYPLIMRLASMPNATAQTKILAQRMRTSLAVQPEQVRPPQPGFPPPPAQPPGVPNGATGPA